MIIHTPGSIKKMLRFDGTVDTINNKSVFIITYKDREFSSKSDMYNATTISDGPKPNSAKMLDIMKYIKFIGCESEYILIIDCDDVYLDNNTLSDMICDSKHDIFISSYDSFTRGRGFLNSGVIFGKRDAIVALASIYIDIYDINTKYGITHSYDEWLIGAAVLCLSRKYSISTSEECIKTLTTFNIDDIRSSAGIFSNANDVADFIERETGPTSASARNKNKL